MILRGGYLSDLAIRSGGDAIISSFPNVFPFSVRRTTRGRTFSGMKLWERILACTVDNWLVNIVVRVRVDGALLLKWIDEIHFNFIGRSVVATRHTALPSLCVYTTSLRRRSMILGKEGQCLFGNR